MEISIGFVLFAFFALVFGIVCLTFLCSIPFQVEQNTRRIVQRFGKFVAVRDAGLKFKLGFIDHASNPISLRTQQLDVAELSYTDKGTSVTIGAQVQYKVDDNDESVKNAYYRLANPEAQIRSHVSSAIRGKLPTMSLEQVQNNQRDIASYVKTELVNTMAQYGYVIEDVLITRADPDPTVVAENNNKYASEQAKITAVNLADANYSKVTRQAEAERDAAKAHGEGIALELQAITEGRQKAMETLRLACPEATDHELLAVATFQQYVDGLVKIATSTADGTKVIFLNGSPSASGDILDGLKTSLISGAEASQNTAHSKK